MSLSQMSRKLSNLKELLNQCFTGKTDRMGDKANKPRQLRVDTLEERLLLSVSVGNAHDQMVNQPNNAAVIPNFPNYATSPLAGTNQSTAMNDIGDFVTTWTQQEPAWIRDENGAPLRDDNGYYQPYIDPITRLPVMESNVYARYFTDEVQRITLPDELIDSGTIGRFSLRYGGNEVQRLTFATANAPRYSYYSDQPISGTFRIGGIKANGENQPESWVTVTFHETYGADYCAKMLQEQLEGLGPYMKGVKVTAISSREFDIEFANNYWLDKDVPEMQIQDASFSSGFMAGAIVTTTNQPYDISFFQYDPTVDDVVMLGIPVDPNDPLQTANYITYAFSQFRSPDSYAPTNNNVHLADEYEDGWGMAWMPSVGTFVAPEVRVSVIDAKTFEITFVNSTGKMNIPELQVISAQDGYGNEYVDPESVYLDGSYNYSGDKYLNVSPVTTIKETSDAFRVNPIEVDNPLTPYPDVTHQGKPVVCMDNDGDFVIAWESEVRSFVVNPYNDYDIYARRFTTQSVLTADRISFRPDGKAIQGVRPVGDTIRVNEFDNGLQTDPTIACDLAGNFVVGWNNYAQDFSYFIGIKARWFDRDGNALNATDTNISSYEYTMNTYTPHVAMSEEGHTVFAWVESTAPNNLYKAVYEPGNYLNPIVPVTEVASAAGEPSIAFDSNNRYVITYTTHWGYPGGSSEGASPSLEDGQDVYLQMFELYPAQVVIEEGEGGGTGGEDGEPEEPTITIIPAGETQLRGPTRINSFLNSGASYTWHSQQLSSAVGIDADGDIVVGFQGFFPDVDYSGVDVPFGSVGVTDTKNMNSGVPVMYNFFEKYINANKNADLLPYLSSAGWAYGIDPDAAIRDVLVSATNAGATAEQLGRLNIVLESVLKNLRGGSSEVGFSRIDADLPSNGGGSSDYLVSDSIANDTRDGTNDRILIAIPAISIDSGAFNLDIYRYDYLTFLQRSVGITLAVDGDAKALNIGDTVENITNAINGAWVTAPHYWQGDSRDYATCRVRYIDASEQAYREGTAWALPYETGAYHIFEVTMIGGAHGTDFEFSFSRNAGQVKFTDMDAVNSAGVVSIIDEMMGSPGTAQMSSAVGMTKAGSFTMVWAQSSTPRYMTQNSWTNYSFQPYTYASGVMGTTRAFVATNLFYRTFLERTDTAGPMVTDYYLPNGKALQNGDQISTALKDLVVVFDEQLRTTELNLDPFHAVDNVRNWVLFKDGIEVRNGIESVDFALNASRERAGASSVDAVNSGSLTLGTGKWEAVVTFNGDSVNGALGPGQYTLRATTTITDVAGNALGRNGLIPDGKFYEITFNVLPIDGYLGFDEEEVDASTVDSGEYLVNGGTHQDGEQYFRDDSGYEGIVDIDMESTGRTVASDAEGNFAAVWVSTVYKTDASGNEVLDEERSGIYLRKYRTKTVYGFDGVTEVEETIAIVKVSSNPTATQPTVAMDADGDIVVAWAETQNAIDRQDVFFLRYIEDQINGTSVLVPYPGTDGTAIRANTFSQYNQQHPSISMSAEGDFVIVWESERQDESGYGIYGQRFAPDGRRVGGKDAVQEIILNGSPTGGTFRLSYTLVENNRSYTWLTDPINVQVSAFNMVEQLQDALDNMKPMSDNDYDGEFELQVVVNATSLSRLTVQFVDEWGNQPVEQLEVYSQQFTNSKPGMEITTSTSVVGDTGEFQVNMTTEYDQRFPSVAVNSLGDFVVTWTSWEINNTTNTLSSEIYARTFPSNQSLREPDSGAAEAQLNAFERSSDREVPRVITIDDPNNHLVDVGTGYDGVVQIFSAYGWSGSGALLSSGYHILTAAHVVVDYYNNPLLPDELVVVFESEDGPLYYAVSQVYVHETYAGSTEAEPYLYSADIAILQLEALAPEHAERYDIYRDRDELGKEVTIVGYGASGTIETGEDPAIEIAKRIGWNTYEITGDIWNPTHIADTLFYDFDDGTAANDLFGNLFGIRDVGLGEEREASSARGDSGGPGFVDGMIAGIVSWGPQPIIAGAYSADVRVSSYAGWIDAIVSGGGPEIRVNQRTDGEQLWSDVAIDATGNFVVTWTDVPSSAAGAQSASASQIVARRFDAESNPLPGVAGDQFLVSSVSAANSTDRHQAFSKISMTPTGDFVVTWEGLSLRQMTLDESLHFNIIARRYVNTASYLTMPPNQYIFGYGHVDINGALGGEFYVNRSVTGNQRAASVAVNSNGDMVFVWNGDADESDAGITGDGADVFYRRVVLPNDSSAPFVTDVKAVHKTEEDETSRWYGQLLEGQVLEEGPTHLVVTLSEEMFNAYRMSVNSILNPTNWVLRKDGHNLSQAIAAIDFHQPTVDPNDPFARLAAGRNTAAEMGLGLPRSGKIEVVLTLDGDLNEAGLQALEDGIYELILNSRVQDLEDSDEVGNALDGDYDGLPGGNFARMFYVGSQTVAGVDTEDPLKPTDPVDPENPLYDPPAFTDSVSSINKPAIAGNDDGSFVVVAVNETAYYLYVPPAEGEEGEENEEGEIVIVKEGDIIARRYDRNGVALGVERVVNNYTLGVQTDPDVAMDRFGNYVVVWTGEGPFSNSVGVYARIYDAFGNPVTQQFLVSDDLGVKISPKVAMANDGTFVVTWIGSDTNSLNQNVYARMFDFTGKQISTGQFTIGSGYSSCRDVDIACDKNGNYAVTWTANNRATNSYDIFATTFRTDVSRGQIVTIKDTFRVNALTNGQSEHARVAMDADGEFIVTWQSLLYSGAPDTTGYGVYARAFTLTGTSLSLLGSTSDKLINVQTKFDQRTPDVSFSGDGQTAVITWSSFGQEKMNYYELGATDMVDYGVYMRVLERDSSGGGFRDTSFYEGEDVQVNRFVNFNEYAPVVTMDRDGDFSIAWIGPYIYLDMPPLDDGGNPIAIGDWTNIYLRSYRPNGLVFTPANNAGLSGHSGRGSSTFAIASGKTGTNYSRYATDFAQRTPDSVLAAADTTYVIEGTSGNDTLVVQPGSAPGTWTVKFNGKTRTIPAHAESIVFEGRGGDDFVTIHGSAAADHVILDAARQMLSFTAHGIAFAAVGVSGASIDGAGGEDSISVTTSQGNDTVDISVGEMILSGLGFDSVAKNFENVKIVSGGGRDIAILRDSEGDDYLEMTADQAKMTGNTFSHDVTGFSRITAISQRGNDTALLNGSRYADALYADDDEVVLRGGSYVDAALGFRSVIVKGSGSGDTADIRGSHSGKDFFTSAAAGSQMRYAAGNTVSFSGFQWATVDAGNGKDTALLENAYGFGGYDDYSLYVGESFQLKLTGFVSTTVQAATTAAAKAVLDVGADVSASIRSLGRTTVLNTEGTDLYHLIAFDQVRAKKAFGGLTGTIETATDQLLALGDWE